MRSSVSSCAVCIKTSQSGLKKFREHFKASIERDIDKLKKFSPWIHRPDVDDVIEYFALIAKRTDLSVSPLTIEQMLHIVISDVLIFGERYVRRLFYFGRVPITALAELRALSFITMHDEWAVLGEYGQVLTTRDARPFTPNMLQKQVEPYISALSTIQHIADDLHGYHRREIRIRVIKQESPLDINLEGASQAIDSLKEDVIPWRRRNAQKIAELRAKETEAEIDKKRAETIEIRANATKESAEAERLRAEAAKVRAECQKQEVEIEKARFELNGMKLKLALEIVSKLKPDLPEDDKLLHALRMVKAIGTLGMSELEMDVRQPELTDRTGHE